MDKDKSVVSSSSPTRAVDTFLGEIAGLPVPGKQQPGRLVFAMDATASREVTWRQASKIQEQMFLEASALGGLQVQLVYYRGPAECKASRWLTDPVALSDAMRQVTCAAGQTQLAKVLRHAVQQTAKMHLHAVVFVGDCCEEDEATLSVQAGQLRLLGVPAFLFQEGGDERAAVIFTQIARLSGGAFCRFDANSPQQLRILLGGVAVYAAGGRKALISYAERQQGPDREAVKLLTRQIGDG